MSERLLCYAEHIIFHNARRLSLIQRRLGMFVPMDAPGCWHVTCTAEQLDEAICKLRATSRRIPFSAVEEFLYDISPIIYEPRQSKGPPLAVLTVESEFEEVVCQRTVISGQPCDFCQ